MFNLRDGGAKREDRKERYAYTQEEVDNMIRGYIPVPPQQWAGLPINTHVRYRRTDGKFVKGGFIIMISTHPDGKMYYALANKLGMGGGQGYFAWNVTLDQIRELWRADTDAAPVNAKVVREKNQEIFNAINKIVDAIKEQERRIKALEQERDELKKVVAQLGGKFSPRRV
jgi:hypothetical protein